MNVIKLYTIIAIFISTWTVFIMAYNEPKNSEWYSMELPEVME